MEFMESCGGRFYHHCPDEKLVVQTEEETCPLSLVLCLPGEPVLSWSDKMTGETGQPLGLRIFKSDSARSKALS